jgi:hypothetical protein
MKMKILLLLTLFQSCINDIPKKEQIVGLWVNEIDSSKIIFKSNGTFEDIEIFTNHFFLIDSMNSKCDGVGTWSLVDGQTGYEIDMFFQSTSCNHNGYKKPISIEREGVLNNGKILYLYEWVEEEGGERYKFKKQQ